jgi:hypothetical protein
MDNKSLRKKKLSNIDSERGADSKLSSIGFKKKFTTK